VTEQHDPTGVPPAQPGPDWYPPAATGSGQPTAVPAYGQPGGFEPVRPTLPPFAAPGSSEPGDWSAPPRRRGSGRAGLLVGAGLAGLLLLGGGFALGRTTAPPPPPGPASLMDALRMAQQGTLPCGNPADDGLGAFVQRLCRAGQAVPGGAGTGVPGGGGATT
jgi:hypothetical protein